MCPQIHSEQELKERKPNKIKKASTPSVDKKISETPSKLDRKDTHPSKKCFICNEKTNCDQKAYNSGGIGRCSEISSQEKLKMAMVEIIENKEHKFHEAATLLNILPSGNAKRWYNAFTYTYQALKSDVQHKDLEDKLINNFLRKVELRVIKDKQAFLLCELIKHINELS